MPNAGTFFRYVYVHVCADDIDSLQSSMQIFIGREYIAKDMDKQGKNTVLISDDCLYRVNWMDVLGPHKIDVRT